MPNFQKSNKKYNSYIYIRDELNQEILDLLEIIKQEELNVYYFDHWANKFVTTKFYVPKPDLSVEKIPYDNDTGNILYAPFTIEFISYGDVS